MSGPRRTESERFWSKVEISTEDGCWIWTAGTTNGGYGVFGTLVAGVWSSAMAHRWAYERMRGPISGGLHLDHLCRSIRCVNPDHLEPVTVAENNRRMHAARTMCRAGKHPMAEENIYWYKGIRMCRGCRRDADRKRQAGRTALVSARRASRELCVNGHPWTTDNLYLDRGHLACRICSRHRTRKARERLRS